MNPSSSPLTAIPFLRSPRLLVRGAITAWSVHALAMIAWLLFPTDATQSSGPEIVVCFGPIQFQSPPPLPNSRPAPPMQGLLERIIPPVFGVPEPVVFLPADSADSLVFAEPAIADFAAWSDGSPGGVSEAPLIDGSGPEEEGPAEFWAVEVQPELIHLTPPYYPDLARSAGAEGMVYVDVLVGKDGRVREARVLSGSPLLAEAAVIAGRSAAFTPGLQQGRPVAVWVRLPIRFTLD